MNFPVGLNFFVVQTSSLYVLMQAAVCRRMVGDIKEAAEVYEHGTCAFFIPMTWHLIKTTEVISADPTNNEAKMKLAEIYEITGETRKAFDLVMQGQSRFV